MPISKPFYPGVPSGASPQQPKSSRRGIRRVSLVENETGMPISKVERTDITLRIATEKPLLQRIVDWFRPTPSDVEELTYEELHGVPPPSS